MWYVVAFILGALFMWFLGYRLMSSVLGKGKMLNHVLRNLGPDSFKRLQVSVTAEKQRREELL